ncbi:MAG: hypothetical protein NTZ56_22380 [Acidobacteria bacterium]|nr:hypothetical protein [Acidobacteriota bacterium]
MSTLRFGIPSLDSLLGRQRVADDTRVSAYGIHLEDDATTSLCLMGPDGSGKSVCALHLISRYLADHSSAKNKPKAIYVSTDLGFSRALQMWQEFGLDFPNARVIPFAADYASATEVGGGDWHYPGTSGLELKLTQYVPSDEGAGQNVLEFLAANTSGVIGFVDLESESAGDDWAFLCRLIALLGRPEENQPRHLIVVDAIEGFEMFDGDRDAFGQKLSRRSRVSQIMRLAKGKAHVVLVSEEAGPAERLPEQFVTDAVVRLRTRMVRDYARRTVEIEKVRGQSHIRGEHPCAIRHSAGSTTGEQNHYDDPCVTLRIPQGEGLDPVLRPQSYVTAFPSIHCQSREFMTRRPGFHVATFEEAEPPRELAAFGIQYLDELLVEATTSSDPPRGLPFGKVTALIGDPHTHKIRLGLSFLMEEVARVLSAKVNLEELRTKNATRAELLAAEEQLVNARAACGGVALIHATGEWDSYQLAKTFAEWHLSERPSGQRGLPPNICDVLASEVLPRITCRRLEIHDIPASVLLHIVTQAIHGTRGAVKASSGDEKRIRMVFDDLNTWKEMYPDVCGESLFLSALLFRLKRAAVAALLVDTHSGRPDAPITDPFDNELRSLVDYRLYTWRVPFYGESRIAVAAIPPLSAGKTRPSEMLAVVRELRWTDDKRRPVVDPVFELYSGIEQGSPTPVPLEVRLYGETPAFSNHIRRENDVWSSSFQGLCGQAPLVVEPAHGFSTLHDLTVLPQGTRLDHTLVLQVDEYWALGRSNGLADRKHYLREATFLKGNREHVADPLSLFTLTGTSQNEWRRYQSFSVPGIDLGAATRPQGRGRETTVVDRIPFVWDFGFLLCDRDAWSASFDRDVHVWRGDGEPLTVKTVWDRLPKAFAQAPELSDEQMAPPVTEEGGRATWREFLGAAKVVSDAKEGAVPFDLAAISGESLSCLVLEVWFSELWHYLGRVLESAERDRGSEGKARVKRYQTLRELVQSVSTKSWGPDRSRGLSYAVKHYSFHLYRAWLLLAETLQMDMLVDPAEPFQSRSRMDDARAVASRHWYKTACAREGGLGDAVAVGLPGRFSVRGDWYLAVANNSRSMRLGDRACDLLSSQRANFDRLQLGLGLPTRDIGQSTALSHQIRTALRAATFRGPVGNVIYGDLVALGATNKGDHQDEFFWLWRSQLNDYDRDARVWNKWLIRTAIAWHQLRTFRPKYPWVGGFTIYDTLDHYAIEPSNPFCQALSWDPENAPETRSQMSTWKAAYPVSHRQFVNSWRSFQGLCEALQRLLGGKR